MNPSLLTDRLLSALLRSTPADQAAEAISSLLKENWGPAALDVAEGLAQTVETLALTPEHLQLIEKAASGIDGAAALLLRARLLQAQQQVQPAIDLLARTANLAGTSAAPVLVTRAKLLAGAGRLEEAGRDLRSALDLYPPYPLIIQSEKVLRKVLAAGQWPMRTKIKIALLGSATTTYLASALLASGFREGIAFEVYQCPFGQYQQDILDERSGLYAFEPDVVAIVLNHRDACLPPAGGRQQAASLVSQVRQSWKTIHSKQGCHIIQVGLDCPPPGAWGAMEDMLPDGRNRLIHWINDQLSSDLRPGVSFLSLDSLRWHFDGPLFSESQWHLAKQFPSPAATPVLADAICAHCMAASGLSYKMLVADLDNTLWGGVIGEDGLEGIHIGPPSPAGEAYRDIQQHLKDLRQRGVLLAVCSKNNPQDAEVPFRQHDGMLLKLEDFVCFVANWQDKARNIAAMAKDLSLGLDSFVFLDDSPAERALVRLQLPQVRVPEFGPSPQDMLRVLRRGMFFECVQLTQEDAQRHSSYQASVQRQGIEKAAGSIEEFLSQLDLRAEHGPVDARTLARVTQLVNKTNQFNLTSKRYSQEQIRAMMTSPDWWCRWFRLADKFGDYGLVGVMLVHKDGRTWDVDTWLLSCRALGKRMETFMFRTMLQAARQAGATHVRGQYIPTAKNSQVKDLYPQIGFVAKPGGEDGVFVLDLAFAQEPACPFVKEATNSSVGPESA